MAKQTEQAPQGATYSREELLASELFKPHVHFAAALLDGKKRYTVDEAKALVETFLGKAVS